MFSYLEPFDSCGKIDVPWEDAGGLRGCRLDLGSLYHYAGYRQEIPEKILLRPWMEMECDRTSRMILVSSLYRLTIISHRPAIRGWSNLERRASEDVSTDAAGSS